MFTKQMLWTYIKSYWMVFAAIVIALLAFHALAYQAHTASITPQEAYDHIINEYPGNTDFAEYVRERCTVYGCRIDSKGLIIRDP